MNIEYGVKNLQYRVNELLNNSVIHTMNSLFIPFDVLQPAGAVIGWEVSCMHFDWLVIDYWGSRDQKEVMMRCFAFNAPIEKRVSLFNRIFEP